MCVSIRRSTIIRSWVTKIRPHEHRTYTGAYGRPCKSFHIFWSRCKIRLLCIIPCPYLGSRKFGDASSPPAWFAEAVIDPKNASFLCYRAIQLLTARRLSVVMELCVMLLMRPEYQVTFLESLLWKIICINLHPKIVSLGSHLSRPLKVIESDMFRWGIHGH